VFTIACGFAQSSAQIIVFRVLAGFGGCAPLALGAAVIGDMYAPEERGSAMALYMGLQLGGPAVGECSCHQIGPIVANLPPCIDRTDCWWLDCSDDQQLALDVLCLCHCDRRDAHHRHHSFARNIRT
jgi:MFS family permease